MARHSRYTRGDLTGTRQPVGFIRRDLLLSLPGPLTSPHTGQTIERLPITVEDGRLVGPNILDTLVMQRVRLDQLPSDLKTGAAALASVTDDAEDGEPRVTVWRIRDPATFWAKPEELEARRRKSERLGARSRSDHPFRTALVSGGAPAPGSEVHGFIWVQKESKVTVADAAFRLAMGMTGGVEAAVAHIAAKAAAAWERDVARAADLVERVRAGGGLILETPEVAALRPSSSVSQEVERELLRDGCRYLGVDPDVSIVRPSGRRKAAGAEGAVINVTISSDDRVTATLKAAYHGLEVGADLGRLDPMQLVVLLGALRSDGLGVDADLLEAFLDGGVPDWRERAAEAVSASPGASAHVSDPYEVLGVPRDADMAAIVAAYRKTMKAVHPDVVGIGGWFARVVADAYRAIRTERGIA